MKKRIIALLMCAVMVAGTLTGCGNASKEEAVDSASAEESAEEEVAETPAEEEEEVAVPSEISFFTYYSGDNKVLVDETLARMKDDYPDLTVNILHRSDDDGTEIRTKAATGDLPDVFEVQSAVKAELEANGDLMILDEIVEGSGFLDDFIPGSYDCKKSADGHWYNFAGGIPEPFTIFYNEDVFAECGLEQPKNFDEFKNVITTLKDNGYIPMSCFGMYSWPLVMLYDMAVVAEGQYRGVTALAAQEAVATDPEYLAAAEKIQEVVDLGMFATDVFSTDADPAMELLISGRAGMWCTGAWNFNDFNNKGVTNISFFEYNPFVSAGKEEEAFGHMSGGQVGNTGFGVNANGEYKEFCAQWLLDFLYESAHVSAEMGKTNLLLDPPEVTVDLPENYLNYMDHIANYKTYTYFEFELGSATNPEAVTILDDNCENLMNGTSPEEFISTLDSDMTALFGE